MVKALPLVCIDISPSNLILDAQSRISVNERVLGREAFQIGLNVRAISYL